MTPDYILVADLGGQQDVPADGILTRTICNTDRVKVVLFGFSAGQELSEHTAASPAILHFLRGNARVRLGTDTHDVGPGAWVYMPPHLAHAVSAKTPVVMELVLIKS